MIAVNADGYTLVTSAGGVFSPASTAINVSLITAASLEITTAPPSSIEDTQSFGLTVTALDSSGNPDPDFNGSVFVTIATPAGSNALGGTTTAVASAGVANFSGLTLQTLGTYTLAVSSRGLPSATSGNITVTAGPATKLVVSAQPPSSVEAGDPFGITVHAVDVYGNLATSFTGNLTVALTTNAGGATLIGPPISQASTAWPRSPVKAWTRRGPVSRSRSCQPACPRSRRQHSP